MADVTSGPQVTVVVGVDGAGRTHRLREIAAAATLPVRHVRPPVPSTQALAGTLADAAGRECLLLVDDTHRLDADQLRLLTTAARDGIAMVIARRPTIGSAELAALDEAVAAHGSVEQLAPLGAGAVAALVAVTTGRTVDAATAAAVRTSSGGLPALVTLAPSGASSPALIARVQRKLAVLGPAVTTLARLLALRLDLADGVLAAGSGLDQERLAAALHTLRDEGLLVPGSEEMIPAVAGAILAELPAAERRRLHELIARALLARGSLGGHDLLAAAAQLRAARAYVPSAAAVFRAAGDRLRFTAPAAAMGWYDDALEAGADPGGVAAGRAEAAALLGLPVDAAAAPGPGHALPGLPVDGAAAPDPGHAQRLALVAGAVEAHHGRSDRCGQALLHAAAPGPVLAVPALLATGRLGDARLAADRSGDARAAAASGAGDDPGGRPGPDPAPLGLRRLAEATLAAVADPVAAVALFIEAAELAERTPPAVVLPDTPHALGALVASTAGDVASAEHLLGQALARGVGGPGAANRHRLLLGWVRMRAGRYDSAVSELGRLAGAALPGRERLLLAALSAGVARRSGDITRLRGAWTSVEPVLARRAVDLFTVEAVEELVVAATRLRRSVRVTPVLDLLDEIVTGLGHPPAWSVSVGWIRLQVGIATEDARAVADAAEALTRPAGAALGMRQRAQVAAARQWARVFAGTVSEEDLVADAEALAAAELPWEGSRLVGQGAIRTTDPAAARRLLEKARDLSSADVTEARGAGPRRGGSPSSVLSEREAEVARMMLAGSTYREIGSRLFISPKTVEHHVARIRARLGATTRAELVAALREVLGEAGPAPLSPG
ncbi:MAG TPA: LuxR C-terminal-related transcriptional regulator [Actinoplanes sp.]|nr:LuxR C-terminal-related transcriptional regulator [Actinoplanes sp.]